MKQTLVGFSILFLAAVGIALFASAAFAGAPTGGSPLDALMVPTDWQTLAPNSSLWFYFDYWLDTSGPAPRARPSAPTRSKVDVIVDANHFEAIQFAIYTPALAQDWLRDPNTAPIGRGTTYRDTQTGFIVHDFTTVHFCIISIFQGHLGETLTKFVGWFNYGRNRLTLLHLEN